MIDFNLSEKGFKYPNEQGIWDGDIGYTEEDVKEFIKLLKENFYAEVPYSSDYILKEINKLAGEELAGEKD